MPRAHQLFRHARRTRRTLPRTLPTKAAVTAARPPCAHVRALRVYRPPPAPLTTRRELRAAQSAVARHFGEYMHEQFVDELSGNAAVNGVSVRLSAAAA